jgi:hypothetical protein
MGLWLPQGVTAPEETHKPARQKVCGACVGGNLDRKSGRRADPACSPCCVRLRILLTVLRLFGWKCCLLWALAGVVSSPFQVPRGPACASSGPAHRASSVAVPSVAHICERLGSMRRDHLLTHQRIKTRTFQFFLSKYDAQRQGTVMAA